MLTKMAAYTALGELQKQAAGETEAKLLERLFGSIEGLKEAWRASRMLGKATRESRPAGFYDIITGAPSNVTSSPIAENLPLIQRILLQYGKLPVVGGGLAGLGALGGAGYGAYEALREPTLAERLGLT